MDTTVDANAVARINGVPLHAAGEALDADGAAPARLHRTAAPGGACAAGLLAADDPPPRDGAISEAASAAIEALLDARAATCPSRRTKPAAATSPRTPQRYRVGDRVQRAPRAVRGDARASTCAALRKRAEAACSKLRCHRDGEADRFAGAAARAVQLPVRRRRAASWAG